jgi:diguanylate cyclase (GGDEF)-like protein
MPLSVQGRTLGALSFYSPAHDAFEPSQAHHLRYFADQVALTMQAYKEQQHFEAHLRHQALHDHLTGLPNRQAVQEHLRQAVGRARPDRPLALLLMDLDHFKLVNDALGHTGGDEFLGALARSLKAVLDPGVLLSRWEGDEFAVVLENTTPDQAQTVAGLVHQTVSNFRLDRSGRSFTTGASIGIAMSDGAVDEPALLALADSALFTAKDLGKNQVVLYHSDQDRSIQLAEDHELAAAIRAALREDRFVLHFQSVVRLATATVDHHEALLRLPSADGTLLLPGKFLRAAERFRLMPAIDQWVVHKVMELLHRDPHIRVFVNLSGQSLDDDLILADLEQSLQARPDLASRLSFEITETAAIRDLDRIAGWMHRIRDLGARFALDDFGMGFSSFAYLRALPTDYVKIDGSFIRNLDTDATNRSLVQAINQAAHTLGKTVVAEWVETETLAGLVRDLGIEYGQGYYWGAPAPYKPANTEEPASL